MPRVTKQIAETVANQLMLSKAHDLKKEETILSEIVTKIYVSKIPLEVMVLFGVRGKFFRTRCYIKLNGNGFNFQFFQLDCQLPDDGDTYGASFSVKECDLIKKQFGIVEDLKNQNAKLRFDIETAIFNLRTYANVEKEFPEAFKLLPARKTTALIVNLKDIRCKLDKANC